MFGNQGIVFLLCWDKVLKILPDLRMLSILINFKENLKIIIIFFRRTYCMLSHGKPCGKV